jgi:hypothetical protein
MVEDWIFFCVLAFSRSRVLAFSLMQANVRVACDVAYYYIIYNDITILYCYNMFYL